MLVTGINRWDENLKYNSAAIWTILNLMSYLKRSLRIAEMSGNKHKGYFYEKENFMAYTVLNVPYLSADKIKHGLPCGFVVWKIVSLARSFIL